MHLSPAAPLVCNCAWPSLSTSLLRRSTSFLQLELGFSPSVKFTALYASSSTLLRYLTALSGEFLNADLVNVDILHARLACCVPAHGPILLLPACILPVGTLPALLVMCTKGAGRSHTEGHTNWRVAPRHCRMHCIVRRFAVDFKWRPRPSGQRQGSSNNLILESLSYYHYCFSSTLDMISRSLFFYQVFSNFEPCPPRSGQWRNRPSLFDFASLTSLR